jgi:hypothetical protein
MAIARARNSGREAWQTSDRPLSILFFAESAAEFYEIAVDYLLGFELITKREGVRVDVFYADDLELRADLLESARRMGGDEVPEARQ